MHRLVLRHLVAASALVLLAGYPSSAVADPAKTHTGVLRTKHLELRYRPGSRAGASVEAVGAAAERDLARMCKQLEIAPKSGLVLYLYDDEAALSAITTTAGNGGFSYGNASHIPYANAQTRFHEMVHIVAYRLPKTGDEPRNLFFAEGLANALLRYVHGIPVHAVAAHYKRGGKLPALADVAEGDFYAWQGAHPGFNGYDVAASYLLYLYDTYGAAKLKRYYTGTTAKKAFGKDRDQLEKGWHKLLDTFDVRREVERLLRQRAGEAVAFAEAEAALLDSIRGKPADWRSLMTAELASDGTGVWRRAGKRIEAQNTKGAWAVCTLGERALGNCVMRATVHTPTPCPIQIRLGAGAQGMLVNGAFIYVDGAPRANSSVAAIGPGRTKTELLLLRRGPWVQLWVDGKLACTALSRAESTPPGLAIFQGKAAFEDVSWRPVD